MSEAVVLLPHTPSWCGEEQILMFCAQEVTASFCSPIPFKHLYFYVPKDCKLFQFSFVAAIRSVWLMLVLQGMQVDECHEGNSDK
jgi:hypothetical protein